MYINNEAANSNIGFPKPILVHDMINLLYYEHWTGKQKYFYIYIDFQKVAQNISTN